MGYYITKTGLSGKTVYWTGGVHWSDDSSKKKTYVNKGTADAKLVNTDGKNGGWTGATVVSEYCQYELLNQVLISHLVR